MLLHLLEAALRSFALGGAVWVGLRFLRLHNPQTRMTAWTVVLMASLSMPVLMHWATVSVPIYSPTTSDAAIAPASLATPSPAPPTELPPEKMSLPPAPDSAGAAAQFPGSYGATRRAASTAIDHRFAGQGACLEPPAKLAQQIAEKIKLVRTYFPNAEIGTAEFVDELEVDELVAWTDVHRQ
jgi:hypothetical protein